MTRTTPRTRTSKQPALHTGLVAIGTIIALFFSALLLLSGPLSLPGSAQATCSGLTQEAEDGTLNAPFVELTAASASAGGYIEVPPGNGRLVATDALANGAFVEYCVLITAAGSYQIDGRVLSPNIRDDSFYISVDDGPLKLWGIKNSSTWITDTAKNATERPIIYNLDAGEHTFKLYQREDGTRLDRFSFVPVDVACGGLSQEAEAGLLTSPFTVTSVDGADYISVPNGAAGSGLLQFDPAGPQAVFCVDVPADAAYRIDAVAIADTNRNDSFYVTVDDGAEALWDVKRNDGTVQTDSVANRGIEDPVIYNLTAGEHTVRFHMREDGTLLDRFTLVPLGEVRMAFDDNEVPGVIQAEDFDIGNAASPAYNDDATRAGTATDERPEETVDLYLNQNGEGFVVGQTRDGEWTEYTVNALQAGTYEFRLKVASGKLVNGVDAAGTISVSVDGSPVGVVDFTATQGGWWQWQTPLAGSTFLSAGEHVVRLTWGDGAEINLDEFELTFVDAMIPEGCAGLRQEGESGVLTGNIVIEDDPEASGGSYIIAPEFENGQLFQFPAAAPHTATYCVYVEAAGTYQVDARVQAARDRDDSFYVVLDGNQHDTWDYNFDNNPDWQIDQIKTRTPLGVPKIDPLLYNLSAGEHEFVIYQREDGMKLDWFEFIKVNDAPTAPTPTPTITPTPIPPTPVPPTPTPVVPAPAFVVIDGVVQINPYDDLQTAINQYPAGTTFKILAGVHVNVNVVPKDGQIFEGEDGAILDGYSLSAAAFRPSTSDITGVVIRNLEIKNYASTKNSGAIWGVNFQQGTEGIGWIVEDNNIHHNGLDDGSDSEGGAGILAGPGMQILGNEIHHNYQVGITGGTNASLLDGVVISGNDIHDNNTAQASFNFHSGGIKILGGTNMTITGNTVTDNWGVGIHCDKNCDEVTIADNTVTYSLARGMTAGILYELSSNGTIRQNTVESITTARPNRRALIRSSESAPVTVELNTMIGGNTSGSPEVAIEMKRSLGDVGDARSTVQNNTIISKSDDPMQILSSGFADFIDNDYQLAAAGDISFFEGDTSELGELTFAGWQALGQDVNGVYETVLFP